MNCTTRCDKSGSDAAAERGPRGAPPGVSRSPERRALFNRACGPDSRATDFAREADDHPLKKAKETLKKAGRLPGTLKKDAEP